MTSTMLGVKDVEKTSQWLQSVFGWKSNHGGPHFEELINAEGTPVLLLHHLDAHEHEQLQNIDTNALGTGVTIYVAVNDIDETYKTAKKMDAQIVDEPHFNELAHQNEVTFKDLNGYVFTACNRNEKN